MGVLKPNTAINSENAKSGNFQLRILDKDALKLHLLNLKRGTTMLNYKINNKIIPPSLDSIKVLGARGALIDKFLEERLLTDNALATAYKEAEDAFENQLDDKTAVGLWQGEFWGKQMISASRAARYLGSDKLRAIIEKSAKLLMSHQRADGYLGTYKDSSRVFPPTEEEAIKAIGFPALWNWNIWCRKYTLWAMLEIHLLLGNKETLISSVGMADYLIRELESLGVEPADTGTFNGVATCSIMKPMLILYRLTGDEKYLNFCKKIADRWENADIMPGLIANSLSGKRIREWYPDSDKWAKAYETMSCFDGLLELYRITGEEKYLTASECFFDIIIEHERNLLSSVAFNDVFGDAAYDLNCMTEPCDVIHLMRLCYELYLLTGKTKFIDAFEDAAVNALFASAFKDGLWGARALRTSGRHMVARIQADMIHNHCCVNNMPRGLLNFAEGVMMTDGDSLIINIYTDFEGSIKVGNNNVTVKMHGDGMLDEKTTVEISGEINTLNVKLRAPYWSEKTTVNVNGTILEEQNGYFLFTADAPATITAEFSTPVKVIEITSHPTLGDLPWKEVRWISKSDDTHPLYKYLSAEPDQYLRGKACIIKKGAMLLCRTKLIGNTEEEMFGGLNLTPEYNCAKCERLSSHDGINAEFKLTLSNGENTLTYTVCDYASGTNIMTEDKKLFSIYF